MEDLQSLLEKINRDGVEKANATAKTIIDEATEKAAKIVADAKAEAAAAAASAKTEAEGYQKRAEETIKQAARDVILNVESSITKMLEGLLLKDVETALTDPKAATELVMSAIKDVTADAEIAAGEKLAATLKASLAAKKNFTVITDSAAETGFSVKLDGGRVEHAFTADVIAAELSKRLRADLAKLLK